MIDVYGRWTALAFATAFSAAIAGAPASASAQTRLVMQAATSAPGIGTTDVYVADQAGFFKEEGIEVEIRYSTSASQAAQIVASGGADLGRFAFDPVLQGYDKGLRLKSFYQYYRTLIYYLAVPEQSLITSINDVKGKTIAVVNMGSAAVGIFRSMLRQANMPIDSATLVPVGKADAGIAALRAGRVDGFMFWNEVYAAMTASGEKLRFIKHPRLGNVGSNGYFTTDTKLREKKAALTGFARAIAKASVFIRANFDEAGQMYLQTNPEAGKPDDPAALKRIVEQLRFWSQDWSVDEGKEKYGENNLENLKLYAEELQMDGSLQTIPPLQNLVTNELIDAANNFDLEKVRKHGKGSK
jgi:NitT/TauT family transport system substrate-binding protein